MPGVKAKSGLAGKLGGKLHEAVNEVRENATDFGGGGNLPGGISNGIAQVVECKFGVYEKGDFVNEYFFYAAATVVQPTSVKVGNDSVPVYGLRTQIGPEPICDTPGKKRETLKEHVDWVLNEFRKLGVDTSTLTGDDIEATAELIKQRAPFTRFDTSVIPNQVFETKNGKIWVVNDDGSGKPKGPYDNKLKAKAANPYVKERDEVKNSTPKVYHKWTGEVPDFNPDLVDGTVDEGGKTVDEAHAEGNGQEQWDKDAAAEAGAESVDLEALATAAAADDNDAMEKLEELAIAAGKTAEEVKEASSWEEVVGWITEGGDGAPTGEEEGPTTPEKDSVWFYKPVTIDAKSKKQVKAKKAVECTVLSVDAKAETVTLKNNETGKVIIGGNKKPLVIKWSDLEQGE